MSWRNMVTCLVTSPIIFSETRAILHRWFLFTGLTSVLDLKIGIVSSVLDILSRPMWWEVPVDLGLKFPCSYAYFSIRHHELLTILTGQLSCRNLLHLVHYIKTEVASLSNTYRSASHPLDRSYSDENLADTIDSNSAWAVLIDFPAWFYFSNALIFCRNSSQDYLSDALCSRLRTETVNDMELHQAAIYYISWVLSPIDEAQRDMMAENIDELSRSFIVKHKESSIYEERSVLDIQFKNVLGHSKKFKIPKVNNVEKLQMASRDVGSLDIGAWLEKFNGIHVKLCNRNTTSHVQAAVTSKEDDNMKPNLLLARVPIGILLVSPNYLDEMGCEILLHYAATGEIMQSKEIQKPTKDNYGYCDLGVLSQSDTNKWALNGACLVFNMLDIIEDMSIMLFDSEDNRIDFVNQMKGKAGRYLLRCLKMLLNLREILIDGVVIGDMMLDLHHRLLKWKQHGREIFEGCKEFDDFVNEFSKRFWLSD